MTLLVDIGNSRIKWAQLRAGKLNAYGAVTWSPDSLEQRLDEHWRFAASPAQLWVSNVAGSLAAERLTAWTRRHFGVVPEFVRSGPRACGLTNSYSDPRQLGVDRFVAMIGAWHRCRSAVCVVDCGTAATVDAVSSDGVYLGGVIAPGMSLMRRALSASTHALAYSQAQADDAFALNTQDGIAAGCLHALCGFIENVFREFETRLGPGLPCLLTGGEAQAVLPALAVKCEHEPHLVLLGLAAIAQAC